MPLFFAIIGFVLVPLALAVGLVRPRTFARNGAVPSRGKVAGYCIGAMGASVAGLLATLPPGDVVAQESSPPAIVDQVANYSPRILKVTTAPTGEERQYLRIEMRMADGWSGASAFNAAAEEMLRVLQALKEKHSGHFDTVNFSLVADLVDSSNNKTAGQVIGVTFAMPAVEEVNFDNLLNQRLLDGFATQAGATQAGAPILADWCKENHKLAPNFCKMAGA